MVGVTVQGAYTDDTASMVETLIEAADRVDAVLPHGPAIKEVGGDKGDHSNDVLVDLKALGLRSCLSRSRIGAGRRAHLTARPSSKRRADVAAGNGIPTATRRYRLRNSALAACDESRSNSPMESTKRSTGSITAPTLCRTAIGTCDPEQSPLWIAACDLVSPGQPFYTRLNALFDADASTRSWKMPFDPITRGGGRPGLAPPRCFRLLMARERHR